MPEPLGERVLGAQLSAVFRYGRVLVPFNALNAFWVAFAYRDLVEAPVWSGWLLIQAVFTAQRFWTLWAFSRDEAAGFKTPPKIWSRHAWVGAFFGGLLWAVWMLAWRGLPLGHLAVEGVILSCGALIIFSPYLPSFYAFTLPLTAGYAYVFFSTPALVRPLGLGGIPFFILLSSFAHLWNRNLKETYRLRFENQDLVESLTKAKTRAEEALAAKTRFLAVASHDLRQPLQAQGLFLHALSGNPVPTSAKRGILAKLQATHKALSSLLDGLLDLSLAESGTLKPRIQTFPLRPLFEKLKAEFTPLARRKGLAFSAALPLDWAQSDPELLGRMLRNLLSNAIRYTQKGRVTLACRRDRQALVLEVWDTGPGIPPEERQNVFKEFYQLRNPERDRSKGLGLGLSIVRGLGETLGHTVGLASRPELRKGCLFTIRVPRADRQRRSPDGKKNSPIRFHGEAVLVLDDEKDIREGLCVLLRSWNLTPLAADSMEGALGSLHPSKGPRALLCDYQLQEGKTGLEAIRTAQRVLGKQPPAALVTGNTSPAVLREAGAIGVPVLFKPVDPARLRALLEGFLIRS